MYSHNPAYGNQQAPYQDYRTAPNQYRSREYDQHQNNIQASHWSSAHPFQFHQALYPTNNYQHSLPPPSRPMVVSHSQGYSDYTTQYSNFGSLEQRLEPRSHSNIQPTNMMMVSLQEAESKHQCKLEIKGAAAIQNKPEIKKETSIESKPEDRKETVGEMLDKMVQCLLSKNVAGVWTDSQYDCWKALSRDIHFEANLEDKEKALNLLVDTFHYLDKAEDQERVVDLIYNCCEPDVNLEVRLGVQY